MYVHQQFAVEHGHFRVLLEGQEVLVHLVAGGTDNLHGAVALQSLLHGSDGVQVGRAADVARAVVVVHHVQRVLLGQSQQSSVL